MNAKKSEKEGGYSYVALLVIVLVSWGIVPGFAKLGNLPGDVTTLWVNWVALGAVALLVTIQGKWQLLSDYHWKDYAMMSALGVAWPLVYSIAYFQAVQVGGPALTTILNYTWPVFVLVFAFLINRAKITWASAASVALAATAVGITCFLEHSSSMVLALPAIALGLTAAATQGFVIGMWCNNAYGIHKYSPLSGNGVISCSVTLTAPIPHFTVNALSTASTSITFPGSSESG